MLVLLLIYPFSFIHCNNESRSSEDTELKVNSDLGVDLELDNDEAKTESWGKRKRIFTIGHNLKASLFL